jgi:hypothetical protein
MPPIFLSQGIDAFQEVFGMMIANFKHISNIAEMIVYLSLSLVYTTNYLVF